MYRYNNGIIIIINRTGADIDVPDVSGYRPVYAASWQGHVEVVKTLLKHGTQCLYLMRVFFLYKCSAILLLFFSAKYPINGKTCGCTHTQALMCRRQTNAEVSRCTGQHVHTEIALLLLCAGLHLCVCVFVVLP